MATHALRETLARNGQEHLLDGLDDLDSAARRRFLARLGEIDWAELRRPAEPPSPTEVEPPEVVRLAERAQLAGQRMPRGEEAFREGRVAVLVLAGGEGTRLGFDGPKGCFPIGPLSGRSLYRLQAEKVVSLSRRVGAAVPLLVMTSPATDAATRAHFAEHGSFGLGDDQLRPFVQGTLPSLDRAGEALLAAPGTLLENPDGHGGSLEALAGSGNLERLRVEGIAYLLSVQVDNVLAPVDDAFVVGSALRDRADVVTKVLEKTGPDERVGHLVRVGGRDRVVEYTELTPEQLRARDDAGELLYRWGSPALHVWSIDFLARLVERGYRPPLHRSAKPLQAWIDGAERDVDGWKHERFVFDLLAEAERSTAIEIDRAAEFAPVKNATGDDSPATATELAQRQYVEWLAAAGARVALPPGARVEIGPLAAGTREQFLARWDGRLDEVAGDLLLDGA